MDEEPFRNRFRRDYIGDLIEARGRQPMIPRPEKPAPQSENLRPNLSRPKPVAIESVKPGPGAAPPEAAPPVAKLHEPSHRKIKRPKNRNSLLALALITALILAGSSYFIFRTNPSKNTSSNKNSVLADSTTAKGYVLKAYYPTNLPTGFKFDNDTAVLKANVLYYSVSDSKANKFYITLEAIPPNFDFDTFYAKFLKPDQYVVNVGSVVAGQVGANLIASIQTTSNVWIIINSNLNSTYLPELETITRSFEPAS
jgi:hypothetical protein